MATELTVYGPTLTGHTAENTLTRLGNARVSFTNPPLVDTVLIADAFGTYSTLHAGGTHLCGQGYLEVTSTSTANRLGRVFKGSTGGSDLIRPTFFAGGAANKKWWQGFYAKFPNAGNLTGTSRAGISGQSSSIVLERIVVGILEARSVTKFSADFDGGAAGAMLSTVNIDSNWHLFELWNDGSQIGFAVDRETPVLQSASYPSTDWLHGMRAFNHATTNQEINVRMSAWVGLAERITT